MPCGNFAERVDDRVRPFLVEWHEVAVVGEATAGRRRVFAVVLAAQKSARERAPHQNTELAVLGKRQPFGLELAPNEAVVELRGDVLFEVLTLLQSKRRSALPRVVVR